jgi:DNA ligase (NAD+)
MSMSTENLKKHLDYLQESYNNTGDELVSDDKFDELVKQYEKESGLVYSKIGATSRGDVFKLPYKMPSLDKIKDGNSTKVLEKFLSRYDPRDILIQDKLDGIALELIYKEGILSIYKRGDGNEGPDISFIQNFINFPKLDFDIAIRGELIMYNEIFNELNSYLIETGKKAKNSRSVVNGATNNCLSPDKIILNNCTFVAFEILGSNTLPIVQLEMLSSYGFTTVNFVLINNPTYIFLKEYLIERRKLVNYRIDGLVLKFNLSFEYSDINENPKYSIAFKIDTIEKAKVIDVKWNFTSKDGYLTPVVLIEPIEIHNSIIRNVTLHNGKMILDNGICPGVEIEITLGGDIIPKFIRSITRGEPIEPNIPFEIVGQEYKVKNHDSYPEVQCCKIKYFLDSLGIKKFGLITISKLYFSGLTSIGKIIRVTKKQLMLAEHIKETGAIGLLKELHKGIKNATLPKIMKGCCIFGEGIGESILEKFIENFPNWKIMDPTYENIISKADFGPVRSQQIFEMLPKFKIWLSLHPELEGISIQKEIKSNILSGKIFVFTGFTNQKIKQDIESLGGVVKENFVVNVNVVVADNINSNTSKAVKARESNGKIKLISKEQLLSWIGECQK